jgi:ribosomal protein L12E/L44/L45/RPP1/RPP2
MTRLCKMFCPDELKEAMKAVQKTGDPSAQATSGGPDSQRKSFDDEEEEEEEEED